MALEYQSVRKRSGSLLGHGVDLIWPFVHTVRLALFLYQHTQPRLANKQNEKGKKKNKEHLTAYVRTRDGSIMGWIKTTTSYRHCNSFITIIMFISSSIRLRFLLFMSTVFDD